MYATLENMWPTITAFAAVALLVVVLAFVVLRVRDERAAIAWVGIILLSPVVGAIAYLLVGINRIKRRARSLRPDAASDEPGWHVQAAADAALAGAPEHIVELAALGGRVVDAPLVSGNAVEPLVDGDEAYDAMLAAIEGADVSVALASYIFDDDDAGRRFVSALAAAVRRGVAVRVLIDGVGSHYSWPTVVVPLRKQGVPVARFLHSFWPWKMPYLNLRSHRKVLIVDGRTGFTGGINITRATVFRGGGGRIHDTHFRVRGPVVRQLMHTFADDWSFTTRETLSGESWFPDVPPAGPVTVRAIASGPDHDLERLRWVMLGAIGQARRRIAVATPYFLPDTRLATALSVAAMRGVVVDIVMPVRSNLPYVQWASWPRMGEIARTGCRLWLADGVFDHSKLMVVDDAWSLIGSSNWDERSLRLNFELDVECYDRGLALTIAALIDRRLAAAKQVTAGMVAARSLPVRLRDGVARLFSPYL